MERNIGCVHIPAFEISLSRRADAAFATAPWPSSSPLTRMPLCWKFQPKRPRRGSGLASRWTWRDGSVPPFALWYMIGPVWPEDVAKHRTFPHGTSWEVDFEPVLKSLLLGCFHRPVQVKQVTLPAEGLEPPDAQAELLAFEVPEE